MLLCSTGTFAQDVIVKKNGSTILCRILEVNSSEVVYKKWNNLKGNNYVMERSDVTAINYENGKKELLSEPGFNQYAPGNQNTGQQQMNDNALLRMDYNAQKTPEKVKKLKAIGWTGGLVLIGGGLFIVAINNQDNGKYGACAIAAGAIWTGAFLYSAKRYQKIVDSMVLNTPIWQNEFKLKEGNSLMAGVDLLKDNLHQTNTVGLALRCNF